MSITFNILWVEDDKEYLQSSNVGLIDEHINSHGFKVKIEYRSSETEINMDVDGRLYDLIVLDYNITQDGKNGADVIRSVRDKHCLTEVIFYSGYGPNFLKKVAYDEDLEGVYFSGKDSEVLLYKMCNVFDLKMRRLIDLDNIRGLVMSGVADLDRQLLDIILKFNNKIVNEHQLELRKKIVDKMMPSYKDIKKLFSSEEILLKKSFNDSLDKLKNLEPNPLEQLIYNRAFSSFKRIETVKSLCDKHANTHEQKTLIEDIFHLLDWRNALAHQNPTIRENESIFTVGKQEIPFNQEESKKILCQLIAIESRIDTFAAVIEGLN
ncbi:MULTISPECIES: response regulator [Yersinia]|uniref:response regulator n=1 Tax=Yersinia TaxID=629 RepID=UPI00065A8C0E|nr:response regulator [Yersinia enterocolitica]CRY36087.1 putative prophage encoded two-component system response regulator [Yersinia enterocolitica]